jgi:hypothetical protein
MEKFRKKFTMFSAGYRRPRRIELILVDLPGGVRD